MPEAGPTGSAHVRSRTSFRPATIFHEVKGHSLLDQLKDALTQGGASRVTVRHNGTVVWELHLTSAILDDITKWVIGPISGLLRLLGAEQEYRIEITNELVEDYNQGNKFYDDGRLEDAKATYKRCIERDKYFAPGHLSLGAVYEAQQDIAVAIKCYQNTVKIDPAGEAGRFARENLRRLRGF